MASEGLVVALGVRTYAVERPWPAAAPAGFPAAQITDCALDPAGHLHVFLRADSLVDAPIDPVVVFGPDGRFLRAWGRDIVVDAHSLCIARDGRVFLVDRDAHEIVVTDGAGAVVMRIGTRHGPNRPFSHPTDVAVGPRGDIYVADGYGASFVHRFDPGGRLVATWGGPGTGPGQFTTPHGIAVLPDGRVLVGDRENNRVQVFTPEGGFLAAWGDFFHPMDVHVDQEGLVHVTDQIPRLSLLAPDGTLIGRCRPVLNGAHGMDSAPDGTLYLAELNPNRVTRLRPVG